MTGNLTVPTGNISADWNGVSIRKQFDMDANFFPKAEQKYGEYRQYVKGKFSTPTGDLKHDLGGGVMLDPNNFIEDGPGQYGHRENPDYDAPNGKDIYNNPDRPTGNHYVGRDTPSLTPGGTGKYTLDLAFKGELIDKRNGSAFKTAYWNISRTIEKK